MVDIGTVTYHAAMEEGPDDRAARRRATWSGAVYREDQSPEPRPLHRANVEQMLEVSVRAWQLAGRALPSYSRSEAPGRVLRPWRR